MLRLKCEISPRVRTVAVNRRHRSEPASLEGHSRPRGGDFIESRGDHVVVRFLVRRSRAPESVSGAHLLWSRSRMQRRLSHRTSTRGGPSEFVFHARARIPDSAIGRISAVFEERQGIEHPQAASSRTAAERKEHPILRRRYRCPPLSSAAAISTSTDSRSEPAGRGATLQASVARRSSRSPSESRSVRPPRQRSRARPKRSRGRLSASALTALGVRPQRV